tara:strand:+ start:282 stop:419 length:138 start_codon:yes stop_codon:yes gene_type:complete
VAPLSESKEFSREKHAITGRETAEDKSPLRGVFAKRTDCFSFQAK